MTRNAWATNPEKEHMLGAIINGLLFGAAASIGERFGKFIVEEYIDNPRFGRKPLPRKGPPSPMRIKRAAPTRRKPRTIQH